MEDLIRKIPDYIKIFIMPGNHDPGRRALPQPAIPKKFNSGLWERENVVMVGNPSIVSLNGVKVLMFHGHSIDDIVKTTPGLSYDSPTDVMKHLLRARHLSPIYGSQTPIAPEIEDFLVIEDIPDIFHVGHVHRAQLDMYKGILLINSGSWQNQTPFQASVGMTPNPGIALMVNLKTFQVLHQNYNSKLDNILQS
jgi:DNA polymerase II small subunit